MKKVIIFLILIISQFVSMAQIQMPSFDELDSTVRKIHIKDTEPAKIALKLTANLDTDLEKVRAIFIWITDNIAYDCEKMNEKPKDRSTDIKKVIKKGKGICGDYSKIFEEMCEAVNIEAGTIIGYTKSKMRDIGKKPRKPLHAWNWVKIYGETFLLDATWASGYAECKRAMEFEKVYLDTYFFTPPATMIMNHYPLDEQYQFLPNNVEIDTFKSLPLNGAGFGKYNVQSFFPRNGLISETQDSIKIRFEFEKSPKQVFLQFDRKMTGYSLEIIDDKISFDLELPLDRPRQIVIVAYDENNYRHDLLIYRIE